MKIKNSLILTTIALISMPSIAASSYEKEYERLKKFRFGSFSIELLKDLEPKETKIVNGLEMMYFDNKTLLSHPFSRGFYPNLSLITDKNHTSITYKAKFKDMSDCIRRVGQKEMTPFYYATYKTRAIKKHPSEEKWLTIIDDKIDKSYQINSKNFDLVTDSSFAKGYLNPLYPNHAGSFEKPQDGDFYFEMKCEEDGSMRLHFEDVKTHKNEKK